MRFFLVLGALLTLLLPSEAATRPSTRTDDDGWVITARNPTGDYHAAAVANGELGVTVGRELFSLGQLLLGGASESGSEASVSRILEGINPLGLSLRIDGQPVDNAAQRPEWQQIDLRRGVHASLYRIDRLTIETRVRALRNMPYALMTEVRIEADRDAELLVANRASIPAIFTDTLREMRTVSCEDRIRMYIQRTSGRYDGGEERIVASSTFLGDGACEALPSGELRIVLRKGETARFALVGSICTTESFNDPWNESERQVIYAVREGIDHLIEAHERLWERLWQSDIEIEGDREAQLQTRFALYSLYGSIREGSRRSIPPMGLTMPGYTVISSGIRRSGCSRHCWCCVPNWRGRCSISVSTASLRRAAGPRSTAIAGQCTPGRPIRAARSRPRPRPSRDRSSTTSRPISPSPAGTTTA